MNDVLSYKNKMHFTDGGILSTAHQSQRKKKIKITINNTSLFFFLPYEKVHSNASTVSPLHFIFFFLHDCEMTRSGDLSAFWHRQRTGIRVLSALNMYGILEFFNIVLFILIGGMRTHTQCDCIRESHHAVHPTFSRAHSHEIRASCYANDRVFSSSAYSSIFSSILLFAPRISWS